MSRLTRRSKVHLCCVLVMVVCEAQTAAMKFCKQLLQEAGDGRYVD